MCLCNLYKKETYSWGSHSEVVTRQSAAQLSQDCLCCSSDEKSIHALLPGFRGHNTNWFCKTQQNSASIKRLTFTALTEFLLVFQKQQLCKNTVSLNRFHSSWKTHKKRYFYKLCASIASVLLHSYPEADMMTHIIIQGTSLGMGWCFGDFCFVNQGSRPIF